ncbi:unnamed protein product, partial [Sphagnum compactum]
MVELGCVAVASLVQTWDGAEPDEYDGKALENWRFDQTQATPPSCLSDVSVLLAATLRYMPDSTAAATMKEAPLLQVWANLVADWNAWEDEEDEAILIPRGSCCFAGKMSHVPLYKVWDTTSTSTSVEEDGSSNVTEDGASQGLLTWAEALAGLAESAFDPGFSLKSEMKLAVIGLQKVLVHMINSDTLQWHKVFEAVHNCLHLLLEATVDLKGSESANSNDEHGETEEEFLERYAKTACELQEEAVKETENGQDEDGHEIEL